VIAFLISALVESDAYVNLAKTVECGFQYIRLDIDDTPIRTPNNNSLSKGDHVFIGNLTAEDDPVRIAGGSTVFKGEFPAVVSLQIPDKFGGYKHICGGTVIDERHVLTAAHCVMARLARDITVVFKEYDLSQSEPGRSAEERVKPSKIIVHSKFDFRKFVHDIALIRIDPPINFGADPLLNPACLPERTNSNLSPSEASALSYAHLPATVTGWGKLSEGGPAATVLQKVTVPIMTNSACKALMTGRIDIGDGHLCAGWSRGGQSACQGDSGGPLFYREGEGQLTVIGVVSAGVGCARPLSPGVYTRVSEYLDWIKANAAAD
jgi:secreted trypsin-like serine protease